MATPVVTAASMLRCAHGGSVSTTLPGTARVRAGGATLLCVGDPVIVADCPATDGQPRCTMIHLAGTARVRVQGRPVAVVSGATSEPSGLPAGVVALSGRVLVR